MGILHDIKAFALCNEDLRLAFHGMRAKDLQDAAHVHKRFKTDFDDITGKIDIIPRKISEEYY